MRDNVKPKENSYTGLEIAVIGMAGRIPGAGTIDEFWSNLKEGLCQFIAGVGRHSRV